MWHDAMHMQVHTCGHRADTTHSVWRVRHKCVASERKSCFVHGSEALASRVAMAAIMSLSASRP